jgi:adenine deaminase
MIAADFKVKARGTKPVRAHVIQVIENQAPTRHLQIEVEPQDGEIKVDMKRDLVKLAVVERHHGSGTVQTGLLTGFGFTKDCAIASSVAHDCHQVIVAGTNEEDMALAVNKLAETGGGQVVVKNGKVIGLIELRLAGLMSDEPAAVVARKAASILKGFKSCGCRLNNPNMTMSLLALVVIPELRLSDRGLVDVNQFAFIPVVEDLEK